MCINYEPANCTVKSANISGKHFKPVSYLSNKLWSFKVKKWTEDPFRKSAHIIIVNWLHVKTYYSESDISIWQV